MTMTRYKYVNKTRDKGRRRNFPNYLPFICYKSNTTFGYIVENCFKNLLKALSSTFLKAVIIILQFI